MQFPAIFFLLTVGSAFAGYADSSSSSGNDIGQGQGAGTGYGYSGSFSGSGGPPPNFAFPQVPQFDFSGFLTGYLDSLNKHHQEFIQTLQQQSEAAQGQSGYGQPGGFSTRGGFGGGFSGPDGNSFSFSGPIGGGVPGDVGAASASASIGAGGIQQHASVYPENPNSPNINTRFGGGDAATPSQGGGFRSVFTSSRSSTTNIDGKPQTVQQASTTVNDNGKITTYTARNP